MFFEIIFCPILLFCVCLFCLFFLFLRVGNVRKERKGGVKEKEKERERTCKRRARSKAPEAAINSKAFVIFLPAIVNYCLVWFGLVWFSFDFVLDLKEK